ncbi:N-acetylmuramoyl-L-alanine amidase [Actinoplanes sp. CA-142083]|uniref:N-acetylmuramoyl-L-alanine amidase n=1 Tax=Actinoplanes sp. CA-142083 TaxID=3239903 RepID=UPI003D89C26E
MRRNRTKRRVAMLLTLTVAASLQAGPPATAAARKTPDPALQTVSLGRESARSFSLVGVTWDDPKATLPGPVQLRTRKIGTTAWTPWQTLEADGPAAGDQRGATDPLWVGASDAIETRIAGPRRPLPAGLRVDLINPEAEMAPAGRRSRTEAVAMPARPVPRMITRAGWGANETIVKAAPEYTGPIQVVFVHHTATGNGYSCADSAAIVRGIQAYQVRTKGWDDIGYNFLVDKCGNIFEGRGGGVGRNVLGAHTLGFNDDASAIAVIGTFDAVGVSPSVRTAIATVAAYKLGAAGNPPNGKVVYTSGGSNLYPKGARATLFRISGHRDAGRTDCPGDSLYRQLPQIRAIAGAAPIGLRFLRMSGAIKYGPLLYTRGLINPLWNVATPSALIARFEVWVDGRLALAAPGSHRTASLRLSPGGHLVGVRAVHLSGRTTMTTAKIVSDPNAPVFTAGPDVALRPGSLNGTVPIRLGWAATDVNGLSAVTLLRPTAVNLGITARSRNGTVKPALPTTFAVRATDRAGNQVSASVTRTPMVLSEAVTQRTGIWRTLRDPRYLGGVALGATAAGSTATWTFTGRSAALAAGRGALSGRVRIWVDGDDAGIVDLGNPRTIYRQAVWSRYWSGGGEHTIRVRVEGTAGRPGVILDGLVYLK